MFAAEFFRVNRVYDLLIDSRIRRLLNMTLLQVKYSLLLTFLVMFTDCIGYTLAVEYQTNNATNGSIEYQSITRTNFTERLSPHYNCFAVSNTTGTIECLRHCADWTGRRCLGFAFSDTSCWVCDYNEVPYDVAAADVAEQGKAFWIREGKYAYMRTFGARNKCLRQG